MSAWSLAACADVGRAARRRRAPRPRASEGRASRGGSRPKASRRAGVPWRRRSDGTSCLTCLCRRGSAPCPAPSAVTPRGSPSEASRGSLPGTSYRRRGAVHPEVAEGSSATAAPSCAPAPHREPPSWLCDDAGLRKVLLGALSLSFVSQIRAPARDILRRSQTRKPALLPAISSMGWKRAGPTSSGGAAGFRL